MTGLVATWQFWALLSAGFAALTAILAKIGVANVHPDFATFIRTIVIGVVLIAVLFVTGGWQDPRTISSRTYLFLALSGVATGLSWLCYFRALQIGDVVLVAPIDKLSIIFVAIFAVLFLGESLSLMKWLGIGLIAAGAVLIAR